MAAGFILRAVKHATSRSSRGASLPCLSAYPQGLLRAPLVVGGLDRAILQEPMLVNPPALVIGCDDAADHLDAPVLLLKGGPALGRGSAHSVQDLRGACFAQHEIHLGKEHLLSDFHLVEDPQASVPES